MGKKYFLNLIFLHLTVIYFQPQLVYSQPDTITNLVATTGSQVTLTWTVPTYDAGVPGTMDSYLVKWSSVTNITNNTEFTAANTYVQNWIPLSSGYTETKTLTGFNPAVTHYFSIKAVKSSQLANNPSSTGYNFCTPGIFGLIWSSTETFNTRSIAWGDYDNDGDLDQLVGNYSHPNRVYRNDGEGKFLLVWSAPEPKNTLSITWNDYDNDGDLDQLVGNEAQLNCIYRNDRSSIFNLVWSSTQSAYTNSIVSGDYDNDGDLDLLVGNSYVGQTNQIFRNEGKENFIIVWSSLELDSSNSIVWGDYDADGDLDQLVGNNSQPNRIYRNNSDGTFTLIWSSEESDLTNSIAWGDYDNDGDLDQMVGNKGQNRVYRNNGDNTFTLIWSSATSYSTNSINWGDYDNDGDLDILVGNGSSPSNVTEPNQVYRNDWNNIFSLIWTSPESERTLSIAWGDYDNDGDLDQLVGNFNSPNQVYRSYWREFTGIVNSTPTAPSAGFSGVYDGRLILTWGNGSDTESTDPDALYYNLRVSTIPATQKPDHWIVSPVQGTPLLGNYLRPRVPSENIQRVILKNLPAGVTCYWSVQTIDTGLRKSLWSAEHTVYIDTAPPSYTTDFGLQTLNVSTYSVTWTWTDTATNETGYRMYNTSSTTTFTGIIADLPANTTYWTETGLTPNTRYARYLRAYVGNAYTTEWTVVTSSYTLANPPDNLQVIQISSTAVTITCSGNNNPSYTRYVIQRSLDNTNWSYLVTYVQNYTDTIYTDSGLTSGVTYYYRLRGYNGDTIATDFSPVVSIQLSSVYTVSTIALSLNSIVGLDTTPTIAGEWTNYTNPHQVFSVIKEGNFLWWTAANGGVVKWDLTNNRYRRYSFIDGLASNRVQCMAIDKAGYKWFGTDNGVTKFDGTNWTTYSTLNGLGSNNVRSILVDNIGNVWLGTIGGGVSKFNGLIWVTYTTVDGLAKNNVYSIAVDSTNIMWFGTDGSGVSKFNGYQWFTYNTTHGLLNNYIFSIAIDKEGNKWFATFGGVTKYDGTNFNTYTNPSGSVNLSVESIAIDKTGNKWIGTNDGVYILEGNNWIKNNIIGGQPYNIVTYLFIDSLDAKWLATGSGVYKIEGNLLYHYVTDQGIMNNIVTSVAIDNQDNKWFGTFGGATKFDGTKWITYTTSDGLVNNRVMNIAFDNIGNKWFATYGGASMFDGSSWTTYTTAQGLVDNYVNVITVDNNNNKWIGTRNGISKYDGTKWTNYTAAQGLINNVVNAIDIDQSGNKWFATDGGVSKFDDFNWTNYTTTQGLGTNYVKSILFEGNENIWFATDGGISKLSNNIWTRYTMVNGLINNNVLSSEIDKIGNKWFGTSSGVSKFDGTNWISYTRVNGLLDNTVYSIAVDREGNKWFATASGVSKFIGGSVNLPNTGTITGKVTKSDGVTILNSATIELMRNNQLISLTNTEVDGNYKIVNISTGIYQVWCRKIDFELQVASNVIVQAGQSVMINFVLYEKITAPTGFKGKSVSTTTIVWDWQDNTETESGYRIRSATGIVADLAANTTFYVETSLSPNTSYYRYIEVYNAYSQDSSSPMVVYTLANRPTVIQIEFDYFSLDRIGILWDVNGNNFFTPYRIYRSTDELNYNPLYYTDTPQFEDREFQNLTTYFYQIVAYNGDGKVTPPSDSVSIYLNLPIPKVYSPSHPNQNVEYANNEVVLSWVLKDPKIPPITPLIYYYEFNQSSITLPTKKSNSTDKLTLTFNDIDDGTWYFHMVFGQIISGNIYGVSTYPAQYKVNVKSKVNNNQDTFLYSADGTVVSIPTGALTNENKLEIVQPTNVPVKVYDTKLKETSIVREIRLDVKVDSFLNPITVSIPYKDTEIVGLDETKLNIFRWDEILSTWQLAPESEVQTDKNTVTAKVNKPGMYRVMEYTLPDKSVAQLSSYPNPLYAGGNPGSTKLRYTLRQASNVQIHIYDLLGILVLTKEISTGDPGANPGPNEFIWDGRDQTGNFVAAGVYICEVVCNGEKVRTKVSVR